MGCDGLRQEEHSLPKLNQVILVYIAYYGQDVEYMTDNGESMD